MRLDIRNFLTEVEEKYPGTSKSIRNSMETVRENCAESSEVTDFKISSQIQTCKICSEPATGILCKGCQMLETLFKKN